MANQSNQPSAETVARAFVDQYYRVLHRIIDQSHRFYKDNSVLSWPQPDGEIKSVTTSEGINEFIVSSQFKDKKVEVTTVDSQLSVAGGVLVVVTARLINQDDSRKSFSQTFFLAPQEKGYYVLNDILRFVGEESSPVIKESVDENALVASLEPTILSKAEDNVKADLKEISEKSKTNVTIDDQVGNKSSITSNKKENPVAETTPVVENEASKVSYAAMIKQGRSSPPKNASYKILRVVIDAGIPSTPKKSQSTVQALMSTSSGVSKVAAHSTGAAEKNNSDDESQCKSIYIGGLSTDTTRSDLHTVVRQFGPVHTRDIQLKTYYEDGYCCGFVHFQDAISAQNAVKTRHIIVKGREAYIRFKRINKDSCGREKSPSGEFRNDEHYKSGFESRSRHQGSDGHKRERYQQQKRSKRWCQY